jgi:predicted nucleic acid-binding protein
MKVVDSSGWLEFLTDGPLAGRYSRHLANLDEVVTPSVVLFEVYKWIKRERSEEEALVAAAQIAKTRVVELNSTIALTAADLSLEHGLAMADSIVYATALLHRAELVTSDQDFALLPGVEYLEKLSK